MTHYAISSETLPGAAFDAGWMTLRLIIASPRSAHRLPLQTG